MQGLIEGRVVHYVAYNGRHLAALVTGGSFERGIADLAVFTNMENVNGVKSGGLQFHFDVAYSTQAIAGTWHWTQDD